MKRLCFFSTICAVLLIALCACDAQIDTKIIETESSEMLQAEASDLWTEPKPAQHVQETKKQIADGKLLLKELGTYSGLYPEDGSDEAVENIAAVLIENVSEQTCQYCRMCFRIGGEETYFTLSELPAGKSAWVFAENRVTGTENEPYEFLNDTSVFRSSDTLNGFSWQSGEGSVSLTNNASENYQNVYVYYKLCGKDGAYLGGICYRAAVGEIAIGETKTVTAGHFFEGACEVVGIYSE